MLSLENTRIGQKVRVKKVISNSSIKEDCWT